MINNTLCSYKLLLIILVSIFCNNIYCQKNSNCNISEYYKTLNNLEMIEGYYIGKLYGPTINQKVKNLKLYDSNGNLFNLYKSLKSKPVLLISGSYTCPKFRNIIKDINKIEHNFNNEIDLNVVYINEAHPSNEKSIYFNRIKVGRRNIKEHIIYPQPVTYGDRLIMAQEAATKLHIKPIVIIDNSSNDFFNYFGASPTCAYIIDQNKKVALKIMVNKSQILYEKVAKWVLNNHK